jgi:aspartyl-tRNA(Asn)/glutamyl-tRNA(Gln) amidotransferase subunit C
MTISSDDIKKLATLSQLNLTDGDTKNYLTDIQDILKMTHLIQSVETASLPPLANPLDSTMTLRADIYEKNVGLPLAQALSRHIEESLYIVPKVLGED